MDTGSSNDSHSIALKMRLPDDASETTAKGQEGDHHRSHAEPKALAPDSRQGLIWHLTITEWQD